MIYLAVAPFPSALTLASYWLVNSEGIRRELFSYQSNAGSRGVITGFQGGNITSGWDSNRSTVMVPME